MTLRTPHCRLILLLPIFLTLSCAKHKIAPQSPTAENPDPVIAEAKMSKLAVDAVSAYDLTNSLPRGYVKTGNVDYTSYLQNAINNNSNVTFPNFPILINDKGLTIPSNRTLTFLASSQLTLKPSANSNYDILKIVNQTNVTINNPVVVGDIETHLNNIGEWGNGIGIYSSNNITINGGTVSNCWGDGIYISTSNTKKPNTNINISNSTVKNNRRDGMSITSINGMVLETITASYSLGTSPMCGINFEPGSSLDELQNIVVNNPRTGYNGGNGIQINYSKLYGGSNKRTNIVINGHSDKKSKVALKAAANIAKRKGTETISGTLDIINPFWRQNTQSPITESIYEPNIRTNIKNPTIQDILGKPLTDLQAFILLTNIHNILFGSNYTLTF
ncbi:MAG: hypothetical protein JWQ66_3380 [Mucilaginibacter sp.]|nr:hypothetical protein [Mucilaginibacter sp.]